MSRRRPLPVVLALLLAASAAARAAAAEGEGGEVFSLRGVLLFEGTYGRFVDDERFNPGGSLLSAEEVRGDVQLDAVPRWTLGDGWYVQGQLSGRLSGGEGSDGDGTVRELYAHGDVGPLTLTAGRRIVKWSNGYAFSPAGLLDPVRDPTDPQDRLNRLSGRDVVQLDLYPGGHSASLVYADEGDGRDLVALRWGVTRGSLDLALLGGWRPRGRDRLAVSGSMVFGEALEIHAEVAASRGSDVVVPRSIEEGRAGTLFGRDYLAPVRQDERSVLYEALLGANYTFGNGFNVVAELYHDDAALDDAEWGRFLAHVGFSRSLIGDDRFPPVFEGRTLPELEVMQAVASLDRPQVRQNYLFLRLAPPAGRRIEGNLVTLIDLDGGSLVAVPELDLGLGDRTSAWVRVRLFAGPRDSHFGALPLSPSLTVGTRWHW